MEFKLSKQQEEKFLKWKKKQKTNSMIAIGGAFTFCFTPTGIGDFIEVKCNDNGKTLDLTEDL